MLDALDVLVDEIDHVIHRARNVILLTNLFPLLKDLLDGFGAAASAGTANALTAPPVVGVELPAGQIENRSGRLPAKRSLEDIHWSANGDGGVLCLQKIDERVPLGRHFLAQVIAGGFAIEPDRVGVRAGHAAPYVLLS